MHRSNAPLGPLPVARKLMRATVPRPNLRTTNPLRAPKALLRLSLSSRSSSGKGPGTRAYSWPPFEPGHTLSVVHGVYSDRAIEGRAAQVREALLEICPWLDRPEFLPAVARFIRVEARALAGHEYIARTTAEQGFEKVSVRLREVIDGTDRLAARLAENLGLDPIGQARIAALATSAEVGQASLADLRAEGARILRGAERRLAAVPTAVPTTEGGKP